MKLMWSVSKCSGKDKEYIKMRICPESDPWYDQEMYSWENSINKRLAPDIKISESSETNFDIEDLRTGKALEYTKENLQLLANAMSRTYIKYSSTFNKQYTVHNHIDMTRYVKISKTNGIIPVKTEKSAYTGTKINTESCKIEIVKKIKNELIDLANSVTTNEKKWKRHNKFTIKDGTIYRTFFIGDDFMATVITDPTDMLFMNIKIEKLIKSATKIIYL